MKTIQTPKKSTKAMPIEKKKWVTPKVEKITIRGGTTPTIEFFDGFYDS